MSTKEFREFNTLCATVLETHFESEKKKCEKNSGMLAPTSNPQIDKIFLLVSRLMRHQELKMIIAKRNNNPFG